MEERYRLWSHIKPLHSMNFTGILIQTIHKNKFKKHLGKFEQWQDIWHKGSTKKKFDVNMILWLLFKIFWLSQYIQANFVLDYTYHRFLEHKREGKQL